MPLSLPRRHLIAAILCAAASPPAPAQTTAAPGGAPPPRPFGGVPGSVPVAPLADLAAVAYDVPASSGAGLLKHLAAGRPTLFVFTRPSSSLERSFLQQILADAGRKVGVGVIRLSTGTEAAASKYEVTETPTALLYDRRGRFVTRSSDAAEIRGAIRRAVTVMRIDWPEGDDPRVAQSEALLGRPVTGGILRTMTFQPEWLDFINRLSRKSHFSPGYLDVRTKEMVATYVSALNHCRF